MPLSMCMFSGSHPESSTHIFLTCDFTLRVWAPIVSSLALPSWPSSLRCMWEDWRTSYIPGAYRKIWNTCSSCDLVHMNGAQFKNLSSESDHRSWNFSSGYFFIWPMKETSYLARTFLLFCIFILFLCFSFPLTCFVRAFLSVLCFLLLIL